MAPSLEAQIADRFRSGRPKGDNVVNSVHTRLLQNVLVGVNTQSTTFFDTDRIMTTRGERLRWARKQAGFSSALAVSKELGIPYSTYNTHERAEEPGGRDFNPGQAEAYARKFQVAIGWLLTGRGDPKAGGDSIPPEVLPAKGALGELVVAGEVEAGAFREADQLYQEGLPTIHAPMDPRYPEARQMAFRILGDSMNKAQPPILPGGYVLCIDYEDLDNCVPIRDGMKVVVERTRLGGRMREWSVKEVEIYEDRNEFHPRSDNPRHKPIIVPREYEADNAEEVKILAIVRGVFYENF